MAERRTPPQAPSSRARLRDHTNLPSNPCRSPSRSPDQPPCEAYADGDEQCGFQDVADVAALDVGLSEPAEAGDEASAAGQYQRAHACSRQQCGGPSRDE